MSLNHPVTFPTLLLRNENKSLKAILKASIAVLKKSITAWFLLKTSINLAIKATTKPIPAAFNAVPIPLIDIPIFLKPPEPLSPASLRFPPKSFVSSTDLPKLLFKSSVSLVTDFIFDFTSKFNVSVAIVLFFMVCLLVL